MIAAWTSHSPIDPPSRVRSAIRPQATSNADFVCASACRCITHWSSSQVASKSWTRSPEETTSTPKLRTSSTVPASTPRDVGVGVARGVFHRHPAHAGDELGHAGLQLLPAEIDPLRPRQVVEGAGLDAVDELARRAVGGDRVEEPPRRHRPSVEVEDAPGEHVAAPEVAEQPTIKTEPAQSILDRGEVEHDHAGSSIGPGGGGDRPGADPRGIGTARSPSRVPVSHSLSQPDVARAWLSDRSRRCRAVLAGWGLVVEAPVKASPQAQPGPRRRDPSHPDRPPRFQPGIGFARRHHLCRRAWDLRLEVGFGRAAHWVALKVSLSWIGVPRSSMAARSARRVARKITAHMHGHAFTQPRGMAGMLPCDRTPRLARRRWSPDGRLVSGTGLTLIRRCQRVDLPLRAP